jgi:MSHA biogenesis protein MshQ
VPNGIQGTDSLVWNVASWLEYDWNDDGTAEDPIGLATFGVYRGHDRVIHWQER